jgi:DNA-binding transcriptional ArsR family regulator
MIRAGSKALDHDSCPSVVDAAYVRDRECTTNDHGAADSGPPAAGSNRLDGTCPAGRMAKAGPGRDALTCLAVSVDNRLVAQLENFRLKVFRTVAQHLSFRKAAENLFLTQPTVTLQIKALEEDLGVRLFERTPNGVSLTPQGSVLFRYAQEAAVLVAEAEQKLASGDGKMSGEFVIGVSTTIAQYVLPRLIGAFLAEHPRVHLSLHSGKLQRTDARIERPAHSRANRIKILDIRGFLLFLYATVEAHVVGQIESRAPALLVVVGIGVCPSLWNYERPVDVSPSRQNADNNSL